MNDIVLNGETLEISRVVDSIEIEGFDHSFDPGKMETKVVVGTGGLGPTPPGPTPSVNPIEIKIGFDIELKTGNIITIETGVS